MDIDSFFQNGDMSFGMDGRISFSNEAQYLRADGGGRSEEVAKWFPMSKDCTELENTITKAKADYSNNLTKLADPKLKRGEKRVLKDYNNIIQKRIAELEDAYRKQGCATMKKQSEEASFMQAIKDIANPTSSTDSGKTGKSKTMTYVLYGVGVFALASLAIFAVKKFKAQ